MTGGGWPRCRFGDLRPPAGDERTERRANNLCSSADRRGYRRVRASREVLGVDTDRPLWGDFAGQRGPACPASLEPIGPWSSPGPGEAVTAGEIASEGGVPKVTTTRR